jgi:hypothetical protein
LGDGEELHRDLRSTQDRRFNSLQETGNLKAPHEVDGKEESQFAAGANGRPCIELDLQGLFRSTKNSANSVHQDLERLAELLIAFHNWRSGFSAFPQSGT